MSTENATIASTVVSSSNPSFSGGTSAATPAPVSTDKAQSSGTSVSAKESTGLSSDVAATPAPEYTPNLKFKVYDEEKEFDDMFKGLVKDADTEKKIREFHEKAYGLDYVKPKHEKLKADFNEINTKYTNIDKSLNQLSGMIRQGDIASFLDALNIPHSMVFEFVKKELEKQSAPPETRAQIEEQERIRRDNFRLQQQNEELNSRYANESLQARAMELDQALAGPDVLTIASAFDAKMGKGAFRAEVINRGILASQMSGQEVPVHQAIGDTVSFYSKWIQDQTPAQVPAALAPAPKAPTLPNVSGGSTSPLKKGPRSMEDLKKAAQRIST